MSNVSHSRLLRNARPVIVTILMALMLVLTVAAAPAQAQTADEDFPTEADLAAMPKPIILSETRNGDITTITVSIPVGADTFTTSSRPDTNWANAPDLRVGFNFAQGNGAERIFLFFPTNSIPSNAVVQSAFLEAWIIGFSPNGDQPMGLEARFLNSAWDPATLTWNSFNPAWGASIGVGQVPPINQKITANITGPVAEWVSGARANHGIMIQGDETPQQRERVFQSINPQNGLHPRINITYDIDTTPPTSSMTALPQWSPGTFNVNWSGSDNQGGSGIRHFDVQVRNNGGAWQNWQTATTATSASFTGQNGVLHEFRVRAIDKSNNVQPFPNNPQASTTVDTIAPVASLNALPQFTFTNNFTVTWSGTDAISGIAHYDVEYQMNGGAWQPFATKTTQVSGQFNGATDGATYGFRVRAVDRAGNSQTFPGAAQTQTTVSIGNPTAKIVPFPTTIAPQGSFLVQWTGQAKPGAPITSYDVQFRYNNGPWQTWLTNFVGTSQTFNALQGDGAYAFQVRARDSIGRVGDFNGGPGSSIAVDQVAPFITIRAYASYVTGGGN